MAITDLKQKRLRAVYDHIDIAVRDFAAGKKFQLEAKVHLPGKGTETVAAHVTGDTPAGSKTLLSPDLDGGVTLEAVSLTGLQAFTGTTPNQAAKAVFDGKLDFQNRTGILTGKGSLDIAEPRLKTPARVEFNMRVGDGDVRQTTVRTRYREDGEDEAGRPNPHARQSVGARE